MRLGITSLIVSVLLGSVLRISDGPGPNSARAQVASQAERPWETAGPAQLVADQARAATKGPARGHGSPSGAPAKSGSGSVNVADLLDQSGAADAAPSRGTTRRTLAAPPVTRAAPLRDPPKPVQSPQQTSPGDETVLAAEDAGGKDPLASMVEKAESGAKESEAAGDEEPRRDEADAALKSDSRPPRELTPPMLRLRDHVRSCLSYYYQRPENVAERSPWGIMHALIAYGVDTELLADGRRVNAIGWVCWNHPCRGMRLLSLKDNLPEPRNGPGYQGHEGQLLSMLALSRVSSTYPLRVDGRELTVADLVEYEKLTCLPKTELTFKLIGLAHYLDPDATWTSRTGEEWSIPRLIREELAQPIKGVTCGGTHRLIGFSAAVQAREKRGGPVDGQWLRAKKYVSDYHRYTMRLQNPDGSFSTSWFERRNQSGDLNRRLQTTGHILEWLMFSLPQEDLNDPRVAKSIDYLATLMWTQREHDWEIGYRGHALRALALCSERVFGDKPGARRELLARRSEN